jgi:hypothetical protein
MKNYNKGSMRVILFITLLVIIGLGYYTYSNYPKFKKVEESPVMNPSISTTSTTSTISILKPSPSPVITDTGPNKKLYKDQKYFFSLEYPSDFAYAETLTPAQKELTSSYMGSCRTTQDYRVREDDKTVEIDFCYVGNLDSDGFEGAALAVIPSENDASCSNIFPGEETSLTRATTTIITPSR